jgi:hypothetical protein
MAQDLATLGIKVENGDVVKATSSLNSMAVAGEKTEKATQRLTRRMALLEIQRAKMDAAIDGTRPRLGRLQTPRWGVPRRRARTHEGVQVLSVVGGNRSSSGIRRSKRRARAGRDGAARGGGRVDRRSAGRTVEQLDDALDRAPEADDLLGRGGEGRGGDAPHLRQDPRGRSSTARRGRDGSRGAHGRRSARARPCRSARRCRTRRRPAGPARWASVLRVAEGGDQGPRRHRRAAEAQRSS